MSTTFDPGLAMRATGTAFEILYQPRAIPNTAQAPKKTGPKPKRDQSHKAKLLRDLENTAPAFNTPIATQADSDRTQAIKGRM